MLSLANANPKGVNQCSSRRLGYIYIYIYIYIYMYVYINIHTPKKLQKLKIDTCSKYFRRFVEFQIANYKLPELKTDIMFVIFQKMC